MVTVYRYFAPTGNLTGEWVVWWTAGVHRLAEAVALAEHQDYAYFVW